MHDLAQLWLPEMTAILASACVCVCVCVRVSTSLYSALFLASLSLPLGLFFPELQSLNVKYTWNYIKVKNFIIN